jgi:glycosyltransferase involved in cell wall biosynthesis
MYYHAPLYRRLAADDRLDFTAIFASRAGATRPLEEGYGGAVDWGVDALGGYRSVFLRKADRNPTGGSTLALRDLDVASVIARGRFDVLWLHGYHTLTHLLAAFTQKALRRALMVREDQTLLHTRPAWKSALKRPLLAALLHESIGLYVGTENRRWFEAWGVPPERLVHVPYAVDTPVLAAAGNALAPARESLRAEFGISSAGPVIVTVSRLIPKKQPLFLLEAFRRVRARHACALLIVGSGELEPELRAKVERDAIPDVSFAGFLSQGEVARAYAAADVFALASREHETWGFVVNEAMSFGLPVVASEKVGCAADLVHDGETGLVAPHDDVAAFATALERLVVSAPLRSRLGQAGRERIDCWNYDAAAAAIAHAVARAVGKRRWNAAEPRMLAQERV